MRPLLAVLALGCAAYAETGAQRLLEDKLFDRIKAIDARCSGVIGVATIDLTSERLFVYNGETVFPSASTIKIPIIVEAFRRAAAGAFPINERFTLQPSESVGGSGQIQNLLKNGPVSLTARDLLIAMIVDSDNTATNKVISLLGMDRVNGLLEARNMRATRLRRVMMDSAAAARGDENTASPVEMARFVEDLYGGKLADAAATKDIIDILKRVNADVRKTVPADIPVASKPGDLTGVRCEAAIVYLPGRPFILAVYSSFLNDNENPVPDVTRAVLDYFRKVGASNLYGNRVR